jgi:hypothetical protein
MTPDLNGQTVSSVSYVGGLYIDTQQEWQITIESDFTVTDGVREWSKSGGDVDGIVAMLDQHLGLPITAFAISDTGTLSFSLGALSVRAAPSPKYEAWNVAGPDKQLVVCMPGGELAIWS